MDKIDQRVSDDQYVEYLPAREAAELLGVKLPTLYAYTSRGLIRSVAGSKGRQRRYLRADLDRLCARRDARAGHGPVAAAALRFGEPVLDTRLTAIDPERGPIYRGHVASELADQGVSFESTCELLWTGALPAEGPPVSHDGSAWPDAGRPLDPVALAHWLPADTTPLERLAIALPLLAARDPGRFETRPESVLPRARSLLRQMAVALVPGAEPSRIESVLAAPDMAAAVGCALGGLVSDDATSALDRTLVLCADHELNASAFAARVAASTGADLYACVTAALAALSGPRHGGAADRIEALIEEIGTPERAEQVIHERARRGENTEGFGNPIYPTGDPRGVALLGWAEELAPESARVRCCRELVTAMMRNGVGPTIDLGLVALASALELPRGAALGIYSIARCGGWVAHTLEQYEAGYLLRPRARYTERA